MNPQNLQPTDTMKLLSLILACALAAVTLRAQETLITLGTTTTVAGQAHAYILWQPGRVCRSRSMKDRAACFLAAPARRSR